MFYARKPDDSESLHHQSSQASQASQDPETEFEQVLNARDELLEGLAHDLKNALSSIVMNTSLARRVVPNRQAGADPQSLSDQEQCVLQMFERIQEASERIRMAIHDTLDMTKCVSGNLSVNPTKREVRVLLGDALAQVEAERQAKKIQLEVSGISQNLMVLADHEKVPTALARLIAYGIKVSPPESSLKIQVEAQGDEVVFRMILPPETVSSNRTTMEQLGRIFERQGKKPGLYLVRGIIEVFGGRTWTRGISEGQAELGVSLKKITQVQS